MPLEILGPLVVVGILGITLLLHFTGHTAPRLLLDDDDARESWLRQFPEIPVFAVTLSTDRKAALVQTDQGAGLVWAIGADTTARQLSQPVEAIDTHQGILLQLHDFSAPSVAVNLSDPLDRATWIRHLTGPQKALA